MSHVGEHRDEQWWDDLAPVVEDTVQNEEWPPGDTARTLPDQTPVLVEARVVWADGTEEWVRGRATKWLRPVALVELHDPRRRRVWLPTSEVRQLGDTSQDGATG